MSDGPPVYLNNAGTSWPKAPGVADAVACTLSADPRQYGQLFAQSRLTIATQLGIDEPEALLLTPGCTSALAVALLRGAPGRTWQPGDVVVTSALEHDAMLAPVRQLTATAGVLHRVVPPSATGPFDLAVLDRIVATEPVRVVAVTAASNVTGQRLPVVEITTRTREAGVYCLVDAAQLAGLVPIRIPDLGADAVAFAGHKGPCAPLGVGGLWSRDRSHAPGYCDVGSVDLPSAVALASSLQWLASDAAPGPQHARQLRDDLCRALRRRSPCQLIGADGSATATLSVVDPRVPVADAEAFFAERGIVVRAGKHCAPQALATVGQPNGTIRFSFGPFNTSADVDAVVQALDSANA